MRGYCERLSGQASGGYLLKKEVAVKGLWLAVLGVLCSTGMARAEWTPLISAGDFAGITTDVGTVAAGIIGICLVIIGLGMLVRVLSRN